MTTEELRQIKAAAVKIHAAAVAAGRWDPKPEWEDKLMDIVCDISRAVEADKADRHTDWQYYDSYAEDGELADFYLVYTRGSVEDCLADAVIDILDTVEGLCPEWMEKTDKMRWGYWLLNYCETFPVFCCCLVYYTMVEPYEKYKLLNVLEILKQWCENETHYIDLRRHVELKMKYNEARP